MSHCSVLEGPLSAFSSSGKLCQCLGSPGHLVPLGTLSVSEISREPSPCTGLLGNLVSALVFWGTLSVPWSSGEPCQCLGLLGNLISALVFLGTLSELWPSGEPCQCFGLLGSLVRALAFWGTLSVPWPSEDFVSISVFCETLLAC